MKASLLGCGPEQQAGRKDEMGTEEKCMYEYNLTLSFEATMGRSVLNLSQLPHIISKKTKGACSALYISNQDENQLFHKLVQKQSRKLSNLGFYLDMFVLLSGQ